MSDGHRRAMLAFGAQLGGDMSNPANKKDIEDVLFSIKQLTATDTPQAAKPDGVPVDRLLLTPALRVSEGLAVTPANDTPDPEITGAVAEDKPDIDDLVACSVKAELLDAESVLYSKFAPVLDDPLEQTDFLDEPDPAWDEDALRGLIADVVRQELQGELGEKMTRNIRKLVRREIMRSIDIRGLE